MKKIKEEKPGPEPVEDQPVTQEETVDGDGVSGLVIGAIVSGAVGLAGVGTGGYYIYKASEDVDRGNAAADTWDRDTYDRVNDEDLPADSIGATVGMVVGGAGIVTAAILLIVEFTGSGTDEAQSQVSFGPGSLNVRF